MENSYWEEIRKFLSDLIKGMQSYTRDYWPGVKRFAGEAEPQPQRSWGDVIKDIIGGIREIPQWKGLGLMPTPQSGGRPPGLASPPGQAMQSPFGQMQQWQQAVPPARSLFEQMQQGMPLPPQQPTEITEPPPGSIPLSQEDYEELLRRMQVAPQQPQMTGPGGIPGFTR